MGKGDRKTRAKRSKAKAGLPPLASVPRKPKAKARGRARVAEIERENEREAVSVVCEARARQMGGRGDVEAMRDRLFSEPAGRALAIAEAEDTASTLFAAFRTLTAAYERYCRVVLETSPHAKTGKIEMTPERLATSADDAPPDLRSHDERHRDITDAWQRWRDRLDGLSLRDASAIWAAVHGFADLHRGPALTPAGKRFVEAMKVLEDRA